MQAVDYSIGEKARPLKKKNVEWYCNKLLEYAHDGLSLDYFLYDNYIRRSAWDDFVKKHKPLQTALQDAEERGKGKAFEHLHNYMTISMNAMSPNPALLKIYTANTLGWTDKAQGEGVSDLPPPVINFFGPKAPPKEKKGNGKATHPVPLAAGEGKSNGGNGNG